MKKILISESELIKLIRKIISEESNVDPGDFAKAIQKIFGVTGKSAEKLFTSLVSSDSLSQISKQLSEVTPKSVDELILLIKSSPKFADDIAEKIFSNPTLRNQFDNEIIEELIAMDLSYIKKLEQVVKTGDAGLLFHMKKLLKNTTTISDTLLDGLVKSFKKKHGLINVSEPLVTTLEKKTTQIPLEPQTVKQPIKSPDFTNFKPNVPNIKVPEIEPKMGLPGIEKPQIYLDGAINGLEPIAGRNISTKLDKFKDKFNIEDARQFKTRSNYTDALEFMKDGETVVSLKFDGTVDLTPKGRKIFDMFNRQSGFNFSFVVPEEYLGNKEFYSKVRTKFLDELDKLGDKIGLGFYENFYLVKVPKPYWENLMSEMESFLQKPH